MASSEKRYGEYNGGCHCGDIRFTFKLSPPLDEAAVIDCNCSICRRLGYLLICRRGGQALPGAARGALTAPRRQSRRTPT